jgi:hypothetical protein
VNLESLLSFLAACGESYRYGLQVYGDPIEGEHTGLFPANVAEWCYINSDELSVLSMELEENENAIVE